jgi:hypothetical protein
MSEFKSYKTERYSQHPQYLEGGKYYLYGKDLRIMCSNCGYPNGEHFGNSRCPNFKTNKFSFPDYDPVFYIIKLILM